MPDRPALFGQAPLFMARLPQRKQQYREHDTFAINGKFIPVLLIFLSGWWITSSYGARLAEALFRTYIQMEWVITK
jgi:hypothetical protein